MFEGELSFELLVVVLYIYFITDDTIVKALPYAIAKAFVIE